MPSASSAKAGSNTARGFVAEAVDASKAVLLRKEVRDDGRRGVVGRDGTGRGEVVLRLWVEASMFRRWLLAWEHSRPGARFESRRGTQWLLQLDRWLGKSSTEVVESVR